MNRYCLTEFYDEHGKVNMFELSDNQDDLGLCNVWYFMRDNKMDELYDTLWDLMNHLESLNELIIKNERKVNFDVIRLKEEFNHHDFCTSGFKISLDPSHYNKHDYGVLNTSNVDMKGVNDDTTWIPCINSGYAKTFCDMLNYQQSKINIMERALTLLGYKVYYNNGFGIFKLGMKERMG